MANLVELDYFNRRDKYFQLFNFSLIESKDIRNILNYNIEDINNYFGDMDLFLLDQILKGQVVPGRILDVGFGTGRNLIHFLQRDNFEVYGIETDPSCISLVQLMLRGLKGQQVDRFQLSSVCDLSFSQGYFQTVICSRVFHFLDDKGKNQAWENLFQVLKPEGLLYLTVNSTVNFEDRTRQGKDEQHIFPDGTKGYFLTRTRLDFMINDPRFEKVEPVRNIQYDDNHAETTMVLRKK